jgi:phenylalanyl-tRNA synthetase beta chain
MHLTGRRVRDALVGMGRFEVHPLPFVAGTDATHTRVANPLADDEPHLRRSILETLARRAEYNLSRRQGDVRLFEVGSVFAPRAGQLPVEKVRVGVLVMGLRRPAHFTDPTKDVFDEWDAKAIGERVAEPVARDAHHPSRGWHPVLWCVAARAEIGTVERITLDKPVWASEAFGIEITLGASRALRSRHRGRTTTSRNAGARGCQGPCHVPPDPDHAGGRVRPALLVPDG